MTEHGSLVNLVIHKNGALITDSATDTDLARMSCEMNCPLLQSLETNYKDRCMSVSRVDLNEAVHGMIKQRYGVYC